MAAANTFSALFGTAALWDVSDPSYDAVLAAVGGAAATDRASCRTALLGTAQRSPTVIAFVLEGKEDHIYVGHSLSTYPADLSDPTPFDDKVVVPDVVHPLQS